MRRILPLLAVLCLAFAPAPLPRAQRPGRGDLISQELFQGKWSLVRTVRILANGKHQDAEECAVPTCVLVEDDNWTYLNNNVPGIRFKVAVTSGRGAAPIDWYLGEHQRNLPPFQLGLIRRQGDTVHILSRRDVSVRERPSNFDRPPEGWWLVTLQKER